MLQTYYKDETQFELPSTATLQYLEHKFFGMLIRFIMADIDKNNKVFKP